MKSVTIRELNPQPVPEVIPGCRVSSRISAGRRQICTFTTMAAGRRIPVSSGLVMIVHEGGASGQASNLILGAPRTRSQFEESEDLSVLRIVSCCNFKHVVRTPPDVLNGKFREITFKSIGSSVELFAHGGLWLIISSAGVTVS